MGLALLKSPKSDKGLDHAMFRQMVDDMPVSVMICDPQDFTITYANKSSIEALRGIESVLPVPADQIVDFMLDHNQWIIGTPDDCIAAIERLQEMSGGFGGFLVRVEDWVSREKRMRSYELMARYVMPRYQGSLAGIEASQQWASKRKEALHANRIAGLQRATDAYYAKQS